VSETAILTVQKLKIIKSIDFKFVQKMNEKTLIKCIDEQSWNTKSGCTRDTREQHL